MGHKVILYGSTRILSKMVYTHSRARVNKQTEASPVAPASTTSELAAILEGQAKMQQELADLKKRSADEMEALRQEISRLRRKIEPDPTQKGKAKETSKAAKSLVFQPLMKKKARTILPPTPSPPLNRLPSSQPMIHTSIPPSQDTLRHLPPLPPSPPPTSHLTTSLPPSPPPISHLTTSHQTFLHSSTIPSPLTRYHPHTRRRHPFTNFIANTSFDEGLTPTKDGGTCLRRLSMFRKKVH